VGGGRRGGDAPRLVIIRAVTKPSFVEESQRGTAALHPLREGLAEECEGEVDGVKDLANEDGIGEAL
jgi:hypothetical protein